MREAGYSTNAGVLSPLNTKGEDMDGKPTESLEAMEPASAQSNTASNRRTSKTATPVLPAFSEMAQPRARPTRSTDAPKRSHKKRGSLSVVQQVPSDDESIQEGDDEDDEGEPRYCYCNEVSFGEMVACDNDACSREWFHLSCVGMTKPPGKNGEYSCSVSGQADNYSEMVLQRVQGDHATESKRAIISSELVHSLVIIHSYSLSTPPRITHNRMYVYIKKPPVTDP